MIKLVLTSAAIILALFAAFLLGTRYASRPMLAAHSPEIDAVHDLNLQKTCAEGAAVYFKSQTLVKDGLHINDYLNHYNKRLGKCFVETVQVDYTHTKENAQWTWYWLNDAFEGTPIGSCVQIDTIGSGSRFFNCHDEPPKNSYDSEKEWTTFVDRFMNG